MNRTDLRLALQQKALYVNGSIITCQVMRSEAVH